MKIGKWLVLAALLTALASPRVYAGCSLDASASFHGLDSDGMPVYKLNYHTDNGDGCTRCAGIQLDYDCDGWGWDGSTQTGTSCEGHWENGNLVCTGIASGDATFYILSGSHCFFWVKGDDALPGENCNVKDVPFEPPPECPPGSCCETDTPGSINVVKGQVRSEPQTDFILKGSGRDWPFTRSYVSQYWRGAPDAGIGWMWTHNLFMGTSGEIYAPHGHSMIIKVRVEEGRHVYYFTRSGLEYTADVTDGSRLRKDPNGNFQWIKSDGTLVQFDGNRKLDFLQDPSGQKLDLSYGSTTTTLTAYPSGRNAILHYDGNIINDPSSKILKITTASKTFTYTYSSNQLTKVSDGHTIASYQYGGADSGYYLAQTQNKDGAVTEKIAYGSYNGRASRVDNPNHSYTISYNEANHQSILRDLITGQDNLMDYDPATWRLNSASQCLFGCSGGQNLSRDYDTHGNRIFEHHSRDAVTLAGTHFFYDDFHNLLFSQPLTSAGASVPNFAPVLNTYLADSNITAFNLSDLPTGALIQTTRQSLLPPGNMVTVYDYDADNNSNYNQNPASQIRRIIRWGAVPLSQDGVLDTVQVTYQCFQYGVQIGSTNYQLKTREYKPGPDPACSGHPYTEYTYYPDSSSSHKPGDLATASQCSGAGAPTRICLTTTYDNYDDLGNPRSVTDPNGVTTSYTYDRLGRVLTSSVAGAITTYTYTGDHVASMVDPLGVKTQYLYGDTAPGHNNLDRLRLVQRFNPSNQLQEYIQYSYAIGGNLKSTAAFYKTPSGSTTRISVNEEGYTYFTYLGLSASYRYTENREGASADNSLVTTRTIYNYENQPIARITDPAGLALTTTYYYDAMGRLSAVEDPIGTRTEYSYDLHGNLNQVVADAPVANDGDTEYPQTTTYSYDDFGRLIKSVSPDGGATIYGYDLRGNLTYKKDARGVVITYLYDDFDRLTRIVYPTDPAVEYYYDGDCSGDGQVCPITVEEPLGRLTGVAIRANTNSPYLRAFAYSYGPRGEVIQTYQRIQNFEYYTGYTYDAALNLTSISYPWGRVVQYQPQSGDPGKVGAVVTKLNGLDQTLVRNIAYDPFGDIKALTYGNGLALNVARNQRYAPTALAVGGGQISNLSYSYDPAGNILSILNNINHGRDQFFVYDNLNQLIAADGPYGSYDWSYDRLGNRLTESLKPLSGSTESTLYQFLSGTNRLTYSQTNDPPVAASYRDFVLTLVYPVHHLPQGQPLDDQYLGLLDDLTNLLDRADQGKKNVKLASFLAHLRAFLNHAQLDTATIHRLLAEQGMPADILSWFDLEKWWDYRQTDLSTWTQDQRDYLRKWIDFASMIQIVAVEADPLLNQHWYHYDSAGSMDGETVAMFGSNPTRNAYQNNDASHLGSAILPGAAEVYAYDHLNRRVVKDNGIQKVIYLYDLVGNLIAEANLVDGSLQRQWFYVGSQRVAMIYPVAGGSGGGGIHCGGCSLSGGSDGGAAFAGFIGLAFLGIGVFTKRRKYTVAGLTLISGVLILILMPEAKSQTSSPEQIYYYHNDHLGTPKVVTNQAQAVVWDADYAPFGEISSYVINSLSVDQPFRFPGQYQDSLTGLYYNWNRYYMPEVGRYNRVDPYRANYESRSILLNVRKTISLLNNISGYPYSKSNPIQYYDKSGKLIGYVVVGFAMAAAAAAFIGTQVAKNNCNANAGPSCAEKCKCQGDSFNICYDDCIIRMQSACNSVIGAWASAFGGDPLSGGAETTGEEIGKSNK